MADFVYLSCVKDRLVTRMGALTSPGPLTYIGAVRGRDGKVRFNEDQVVAVPVAEYARFRKEYERCVRDGSLCKRTQQDHAAWLKRQAAESSKDAGGRQPQAEQPPDEQPSQETPPKILQAVTSDQIPKPRKKAKIKGASNP